MRSLTQSAGQPLNQVLAGASSGLHFMFPHPSTAATFLDAGTGIQTCPRPLFPLWQPLRVSSLRIHRTFLSTGFP